MNFVSPNVCDPKLEFREVSCRVVFFPSAVCKRISGEMTPRIINEIIVVCRLNAGTYEFTKSFLSGSVLSLYRKRRRCSAFTF